MTGFYRDIVLDGFTPGFIRKLVENGVMTFQEWDEAIAVAEYYDALEEKWRESFPNSQERTMQFLEDGVSPEVALNAHQEFIKEKFTSSVRSGRVDLDAKRRYQSLYSKTVTESDIKRAREFPLEEIISHRNRMARCPFHNEKSGSLHVTKNLYHCFGCGAGGDTIKFIMRTRGLGFVDSVRYINSL